MSNARELQRRAAEIWAKLSNEEQAKISMRQIVEQLKEGKKCTSN